MAYSKSAFAVIALLSCAFTDAAEADEARHVSANGAEFAYVEKGEGAAVIFVHGGLQDYRMWEAHLPAFAERYRAIAYSRRNHYPNKVDADGISDTAADVHGDDLAAIVAALGFSRVHVVAHSAGAYAALLFAAKHPEMVATLAVNEPPVREILAAAPGGAEVLKEFGSRLTPAREAFRAGNIEDGVRLFADAVGGPGTYDRRLPAERRMNLDNALAHVAEARSTRPRAVFDCETAARVTAPVLLTNGEQSPPFFHRIVDELARCLPNQARITISASSHTAPTDNPRDFDQAVIAFIETH